MTENWLYRICASTARRFTTRDRRDSRRGIRQNSAGENGTGRDVKKPLAGIVMGSTNDWAVMQHAALEKRDARCFIADAGNRVAGFLLRHSLEP